MSPIKSGPASIRQTRQTCPKCTPSPISNANYHGNAMLAARLKRNILSRVVKHMPQYKEISDIPEHLF